MASVNKLSIRGVRSFSPEDAEQVRHDSTVVYVAYLYEITLLLLS